MKKYIKYYLFLFSVFLLSFMAERTTMYNTSSNSKIELDYSNIYTTTLTMGLEDFDLYDDIE